MMKISHSLAWLALAAAALFSAEAGAQDAETFRRALELYDGGMYAEARQAFSSIQDDYLAEGYAVLCSVALREGESDYLAEKYYEKYPFATVMPLIFYRQAQNRFDDGDYQGARMILRAVGESELPSGEVDGLRFRRAFSAFSMGDYQAAAPDFIKLSEGPLTDYTAPSRYCLGYIAYNGRDFRSARQWFGASAKDPRFAEISNYYLVECAFMDKDYRYVTEHGPLLAEKAPEDRQIALSRLIAESYLILGDTEGAEAYYRRSLEDLPSKDRSDYFFAGSLLYALGDWRGAADNYEKMTERTDSLGQVASYQLAYSYIKLKDKVSALDAFREASVPAFSPRIAEDAFFNYAKLSFDLNHNPRPFEEYLERYPDKEKSEQIWQYVALAALYNNDYQGAIEAYDNLDELDARTKVNYVKANYLRARQLIAAGGWRPAVANLRAVDFYSDRHESINQLGRYWLSQAYYMDGQYDKAAKELTSLYALSALDGQTEGAQIPYDLGYVYFRDGRYGDAAKWFDTYLKGASPLSREDAQIRRADCAFYAKDYKGAIARYDEIIAAGVSSDNIYPYYQAAMACGLTGQNDKKISLLEKVFDADPAAEYYDEALFELGSTAFEKKEYDTAVRVFKKLRSESGDPAVQARALLQLGMVYNRQEDVRKALTSFKEVVSMRPGSAEAESALLAIESVYRDLGQPDLYLDYVASIGRAPQMSASEKEALYFRGAEQVFETGNYTGALSSLENFLKRYPEGKYSGQVHFYMAECYRNTGRYDLARDLYSQSVDEGNDEEYVVDAMRRYSELSYRLEQYKDAYDGYQALFDLGDEEENAAYALGMLRSAYRARRYEDAVKAAGLLKAWPQEDAALSREIAYTEAKSLLATSRRAEALKLFRTLAEDTVSAEGAEAACLLIQDTYDQGRFSEVPAMVFKYFSTGDEPEYWMARAYIILADSYADLDNFKQARVTFESIRASYSPNAGDDILPTVEARLRQLDEMNQ